MNDEYSSGIEIGAALREARSRLGIDIAEAEDRTKIRARYLRALESEDWEILPAPAYVRGFLRTYGALLGLDGEMLADEFRRRHEQHEAAAIAGSEPVLQERTRPGGGRPSSRWPWIAGIAAAIVVLLAVLGLLGGDGGDDGDGERRGGKQARQAGKDGKGGGGGGGRDRRRPVDIELVALSDVRVCLVAGGDRALLADQLLSSGSEERFEDERRYRIDVEGGSVRVRVGDERERIETTDAVTYEADSNGIESTGSFAGPNCP